MSYRGEPRPRGMFWRDCPSSTQLPGMSAGVAAPELLAGDLASAAGVLYRCTSPTPGSATWEAVPTEATRLDATAQILGPFAETLAAAQTDNAVYPLATAAYDLTAPRDLTVVKAQATLSEALTGAGTTVVVKVGSTTVATFTQAGAEVGGTWETVDVDVDAGDPIRVQYTSTGISNTPGLYVYLEAVQR